MRPQGRTPAVLLVVLVGVGLVAGVLLPPLSVRFGSNPPRLDWGPTALLGLLALTVAQLARITWVTVQRERRRMHRERGVFLLALAKASSRAGALALGGYAGFALQFVEEWETPLGRDRVVFGGFAALAAALLLAAALVLERALVVPGDDEEDGEGPAGTSTSAA